MAQGGAVSNSYIFSEPPHRNRFHVATRPVPGSFSARLPATGDNRGRLDEGQEILRRTAALQAGILDADGKLGFDRHKPERVRRMKAIHQSREARLGVHQHVGQVRSPHDEFDWASRVAAKCPPEDSLASTAASTASTHFPRLGQLANPQTQQSSPNDSRGFEAWGERGARGQSALSPRFVEEDPLRALAPLGRPHPSPPRSSSSKSLIGAMAPPKLGAIAPAAASKPWVEPDWAARPIDHDPNEPKTARPGGRPRPPPPMTRAELFKRQQERRQKAESAAALESALAAKRRKAEEEQQRQAELRDDSARRIQASYQHHRLRTELATRHARRQEENLAAARIQAIHRGREVRRRQAAGEDLTYIPPLAKPTAYTDPKESTSLPRGGQHQTPGQAGSHAASLVEQDDDDSEADVIGLHVGALLNFAADDDSNRSTPFSMTRSEEATPDPQQDANRPATRSLTHGPVEAGAVADDDDEDDGEIAGFAKLLLGLAVDDMESIPSPKSMTSVSNSGIL